MWEQQAIVHIGEHKQANNQLLLVIPNARQRTRKPHGGSRRFIRVIATGLVFPHVRGTARSLAVPLDFYPASSAKSMGIPGKRTAFFLVMMKETINPGLVSNDYGNKYKSHTEHDLESQLARCRVEYRQAKCRVEAGR